MTFYLLLHLLFTPIPMTPPCIFLSILKAPQQQLIDARRVALEQLTFDLSRISNWGRENMVLFNASKTQFLHLSIFHTTMISSLKTHNSSLHLSLIFS